MTSVVSQLPQSLQERLARADTKAAIAARWDGKDLSQFEGSYFDYLLQKVSKVFPDLAAKHIAERQQAKEEAAAAADGRGGRGGGSGGGGGSSSDGSIPVGAQEPKRVRTV